MEHIDNIIGQIEELNTNDFDIFRKKYFNILKIKQKQKFNNKFPNLELLEYSLIKCVMNSIYYYKFSSQTHTYGIEIEISNAQATKYKLNFYVDGESECETKKIPENKIIKNNTICIKEYLEYLSNDIGDNITLDELENIVNYLFFNKKFVYNI